MSNKLTHQEAEVEESESTEDNSGLSITNSELEDESIESEQPTPAPTPEPAPQPEPTPEPAPAPTACTHPSTTTQTGGRTEYLSDDKGCYKQYNCFTVVCATCGATVDSYEVHGTTVHNTVQLTEGTAATCTEDGVAGTTSCSCGGRGVSGGGTIKATGHVFYGDFTGEISPDGRKWVSKCLVCGLVEEEKWVK